MANKKRDENSPGPVSLEDIARAANVHKSTAARAMRNDARISPETREKVQKLADQLGYHPNPFITALMETRRRGSPKNGATIACTCDVPGARVPGAILWLDELHLAIKARAEHLGFKCEIFFLEDFSWDNVRLVKTLFHRGVSGLIWNCSTDYPMVDSNLLRHFAVVTSGNESRDYSSVNFDAFANCELAVEKALRMGYQRPGVMLWSDHPALGVERCRGGLLNAVRSLPVKQQIPLLSYDRPSSLVKWVERYHPDVIIGNVRPLANFPNVNLPYLTLDWIPTMHRQTADFSGVDVFRNRTGGIAVDLVASHLYHNERGKGEHARHIYVPGTWHEGKAST